MITTAQAQEVVLDAPLGTQGESFVAPKVAAVAALDARKNDLRMQITSYLHEANKLGSETSKALYSPLVRLLGEFMLLCNKEGRKALNSEVGALLTLADDVEGESVRYERFKPRGKDALPVTEEKSRQPSKQYSNWYKRLGLYEARLWTRGDLSTMESQAEDAALGLEHFIREGDEDSMFASLDEVPEPVRKWVAHGIVTINSKDYRLPSEALADGIGLVATFKAFSMAAHPSVDDLTVLTDQAHIEKAAREGSKELKVVVRTWNTDMKRHQKKAVIIASNSNAVVGSILGLIENLRTAGIQLSDEQQERITGLMARQGIVAIAPEPAAETAA